MAKQGKEKGPKVIKLRQPDRSGPSEKTLLDLADERNLFEQAKQREKELGKFTESGDEEDEEDDDEDDEDDEDDGDEGPVLSPQTERFLEAGLWTATMTMLHFTFDVLVMNQYGREMDWPRVIRNAGRAWIGKLSASSQNVPYCIVFFGNWLKQQCANSFNLQIVFFILFYPLHPHEANPILVPGIALRYQHRIRQAIFFTMSVVSGCYLIYITNSFGYLYTMKRAPPLGCFWLWAVVELDLSWATLSLVLATAFLWQGGYDIK